ncbi:hypothetical protein Tdes44962_MAKER10244 [Teratosphaeria destructans]|uniref:Uncharacterized protein n=1 Tax=Teratosphaeria destructans TaxID=418781 RepID=A0A9W7SM89_9PEZI|nr:hypothetical protein Tdes44962_MAKER10244 [Teratosphaeria destructans]
MDRARPQRRQRQRRERRPLGPARRRVALAALAPVHCADAKPARRGIPTGAENRPLGVPEPPRCALPAARPSGSRRELLHQLRFPRQERRGVFAREGGGAAGEISESREALK